MKTSDMGFWYLDASLEVMQAAAPQRPELVAKLCDLLDVDTIDISNPLCMFVETAISQGFLAAYEAEDYRSALRFANVAASVADRIPDFEIGRARTANNRALALMELGDFIAAGAIFEQALRLAAPQKDLFGLASTIRSNISAMESMRAGRLDDKVTSGDALPFRPELVSNRNNRALSLVHTGQFREAHAAFQMLLDDPQTTDIKTRATLLSNMAAAELGLGAIDRARATLELAMRECEEAGYSGQVLAGILHQAGELLISHGRPDHLECAGDHLKRGWDIVRQIAPRSCLALLILKGLARVRMAQRDLMRACAALDRGMGIYDEMRASVGSSEEDLTGLFEIYRQLVELRLWLVPQRDGPLEGALLVQKAKARYWGEALGRRWVSAPVDDAAGFDSEDNFAHLVGINGTMFEFFVGPNATFVCLIHNRHIAVHRVDVTEDELAQQVDALCVRLSTGLQATRQLAALSSTLFRQLSLEWGRNRAILIAPDGPLWRAPISLLKPPKQGASLEDMAPCFYIPSAGVLGQMRRQRKPAGKRLGLVIAHTEWGQTTLAGADDESRFVCQAMNNFGDVILLSRLEGALGPPSLARVLDLLGEATHVHFLAHAVGGSEDQESRILLSTGDGSGHAYLTAGQIEALDLRSELVVLATCESSLGRSRPGEGLASLARAFLLAGARCVIATLWEVENSGAREFFRYFYPLMASGEAPARAYRLAKQNYEKRYGRDGTSAGIIVLGDADSDTDRQDLRHSLT